MVKRARDKLDGRSRRVKLTAKGIRLIEKTIGIRFDLARANLGGMSSTEREDLGQLLKRMLAMFEGQG